MIQERGCQYKFVLANQEDFSRQVIRSGTCSSKFVELDVEVPPGRGQITNIESLLTTMLDDLEFSQTSRRTLDPEVHAKIDGIIHRGRMMLAGHAFPVTLVLDDPAGNSSIQPSPSNMDHRWSRSQYKRTAEQNEALSVGDEPNTGTEVGEGAATSTAPYSQNFGQESSEAGEIIPDEVYSFPATCPGCTRPCTTHMKMVDVPHFKEVIIMSTVCQLCGCEWIDTLLVHLS